MARPRKAAAPKPAVELSAHTVTVKKPDAVSDGQGGFYPVGAVIECVDPESLKAKGFAE